MDEGPLINSTPIPLSFSITNSLDRMIEKAPPPITSIETFYACKNQPILLNTYRIYVGDYSLDQVANLSPSLRSSYNPLLHYYLSGILGAFMLGIPGEILIQYFLHFSHSGVHRIPSYIITYLVNQWKLGDGKGIESQPGRARPKQIVEWATLLPLSVSQFIPSRQRMRQWPHLRFTAPFTAITASALFKNPIEGASPPTPSSRYKGQLCFLPLPNLEECKFHSKLMSENSAPQNPYIQ